MRLDIFGVFVKNFIVFLNIQWRKITMKSSLGLVCEDYIYEEVVDQKKENTEESYDHDWYDPW